MANRGLGKCPPGSGYFWWQSMRVKPASPPRGLVRLRGVVKLQIAGVHGVEAQSALFAMNFDAQLIHGARRHLADQNLAHGAAVHGRNGQRGILGLYLDGRAVAAGRVG